MLRGAAETILGFPMGDDTYRQAALTPSLGGLGLRRTVEHAPGAFSASWHESLLESREQWVRPPGVAEGHREQRLASYKFDEEVLAYLVARAPNDREAQRLHRVSQPHAGAFITAVPSDEDGFHTILRPRNFQTAVAYRLGVAVLKNDISCPMCKQPLDTLGDHATCCAKAGDLIVRHNNLRNLVDRIAQDALLSPVMEKKGILGPTSGRRPGDVSFRLWAHGKGLAIDIAVTSPFTDRNVRLQDPCEDYAATQKHRKYDADFKDSEYHFAALVFETTGAINAEGIRVLSQIFRFAAMRLGQPHSAYCGRAWARISCDLQRSVSQAILSRCDGLSVMEMVPEVPPALAALVPTVLEAAPTASAEHIPPHNPPNTHPPVAPPHIAQLTPHCTPHTQPAAPSSSVAPPHTQLAPHRTPYTQPAAPSSSVAPPHTQLAPHCTPHSQPAVPFLAHTSHHTHSRNSAHSSAPPAGPPVPSAAGPAKVASSASAPESSSSHCTPASVSVAFTNTTAQRSCSVCVGVCVCVSV